MIEIKYCEYCGKELDLNNLYGTGRFCNKSCQLASVRNKAIKNASEARKESSLKLRENKVCLNCGKPLTDSKYELRQKFCSSSCSASFNNRGRKLSEETKHKQSESLKKYFSNKNQGKDSSLNNQRFCEICGKPIKSKNITGLCYHCLNTTEYGKSIKSNNARISQEKLIKEGRHKGWTSRNIESYPEKFFKEVLDNNGISYTRELPLKKEDGSNYFLDFVINKNDRIIDLEIDGKQHTYEDRAESDRIRDEFIKNKGFLVYRIPWNTINSEEGKLLMKKKIEDFLSFYENL